jgi:hypothetical protein
MAEPHTGDGWNVEHPDRPSTGDVLITRENGRYLLSIIPHPHKLTLGNLSPALEIALKWAEVNQVTVWQMVDGVTSKVPAKRAD